MRSAERVVAPSADFRHPHVDIFATFFISLIIIIFFACLLFFFFAIIRH